MRIWVVAFRDLRGVNVLKDNVIMAPKRSKAFSTVTALTIGTIAGVGLAFAPTYAFANEDGSHEQGDHGCSGDKADKSCSGDKAEKSCSGEADKSCSAEKKAEKSCSGEHGCSGEGE